MFTWSFNRIFFKMHSPTYFFRRVFFWICCYRTKRSRTAEELENVTKGHLFFPPCTKVGDGNSIAWEGSTLTMRKSRQTTDASFMQVHTDLEKRPVAHQSCRHLWIPCTSVNSLAQSTTKWIRFMYHWLAENKEQRGYLNRASIWSKNLFWKLHHLQCHQGNGFGMTKAFLMEPCCNAVRITYRFHLQQSDKPGVMVW